MHNNQNQRPIFKLVLGELLIHTTSYSFCFTFSETPVNAGSGVSFTFICHSSWVSLSWADTTNSVGSADSWKLLSAYTTPSSPTLKSSGSLLPKYIFRFSSQLWNLTIKYKIKNKKLKAVSLKTVWYKMYWEKILENRNTCRDLHPFKKRFSQIKIIIHSETPNEFNYATSVIINTTVLTVPSLLLMVNQKPWSQLWD